MKRFSSALSGAILTAGFALSAVVAHAADDTFTAVDTNGDGALTKEEVAVAMPETTDDAFNAADIDRDGSLSEDEFLAALYDGVLKTNS
jgi:hypothetical protein